ncbi:hypothetical protein LVX13_28950 [Streptomyces albulus]|uniref:hypothetical protein n=1 Tax=Streptomyces noursei TaxID=1971 RepID=UPI001F293D21|nr:hypothetical protein [Streptomyces noursei]MCE4947106.1 hypothetical protein [Streptomyces noursei]
MEDVSFPFGTERDSRAWVGPLVSSVVTVVAGFFALAVLGFSAMACDSCSSEKAHGFDGSIATALMVLKVGFLGPAGLLAVAWGLPWERRKAGRRAMLALMAPLALVVLFVACMAMVQWP